MFFCHLNKCTSHNSVKTSLFIFMHENNTHSSKNKMSLQARIANVSSYSKDGRGAYNTSFASECEGSVTVEASIVLPLFLIAMYAVFILSGCLKAKAAVYEGFNETALYLAEYSYLYNQGEQLIGEVSETPLLQNGITAVAAYTKLCDYTDNKDIVKRYVVGGMKGLRIVQAELREDDYIYLRLEYVVRVNAPFIGSYDISCMERIRQRAYLGYDSSHDEESDSTYVYVAENGGVYHSSRDCYHIKLTIRAVNSTELKGNKYKGLTTCHLCAKYKSGGQIYVTAEGDRYHYSLECSGLKRTVYRVKKDECGLKPCSECGK